MKKSLRMLACVVGGATLFGMGCGGAPEETPAEQQPTAQPAPAQDGKVHAQGIYMVCWDALGVYLAPSTTAAQGLTMHYGNNFATDSSVFLSNGEYWVHGYQYCTAPYYCDNVGYVRWAGLCH